MKKHKDKVNEDRAPERRRRRSIVDKQLCGIRSKMAHTALVSRGTDLGNFLPKFYELLSKLIAHYPRY